MSRFIIAVLDSVGAGALPDAAAYGSADANTLAHLAAMGPMELPNLQALGLGNILHLDHIPPVCSPLAAWGKMGSSTHGMDTTAGHWEISGIILDKPMPTYPQGFPDEIIKPFCKAIGREVLGNRPASGTGIIDELAGEHIRTGSPILYTSADSVFQVAAHEDIIPVEELYRICIKARELLQGEHGVSRVIARPFIGDEKNGYLRTEARRDFSLPPPEGSLPELCRAQGVSVTAIGKVWDIFAGCHIDNYYPGHNNGESGASLLKALQEIKEGFIFANFVDFDTLYGHRNDAEGYRNALEDFDRLIPSLLAALADDDILAVCADHGNDPTTATYDHSREYSPLLVYGKKVRPTALGVRSTFADLGHTAADILGVKGFCRGTSFIKDILG